MTNLLQRLFSIQPARPPSVAPGLYHYLREAEGEITRFHLRVDPDGHGILIANASVAARLSPSGVVMAKGLLAGYARDDVLKQVSARFRGGGRSVMEADLERIAGIIAGLSSPGDNYPILNLDDAAFVPDPARLLAPFSADVPLGPPDQLVPIIDRLWAIGIPHLTLLVLETPDPAHLIRAVERAEDTGLITGVRGRASDLAGGTLLDDLARAGVDHVGVFYASPETSIHDALYGDGDLAAAGSIFAKLHALEVAAVAEMVLVESTLDTVDESLAALLDQGVTNISFFAIAAPNDLPDSERAGALRANALPQAAAVIESDADAAHVRYLWQPPILRDPKQTLAAQARRGARCSGDLSMRVELDGRVIPPRGHYRGAGNMLLEAWGTVWDGDVFGHYRRRVQSATRCVVCPGLAVCAADCPREPAGWTAGDEGGMG